MHTCYHGAMFATVQHQAHHDPPHRSPLYHIMYLEHIVSYVISQWSSTAISLSHYPT